MKRLIFDFITRWKWVLGIATAIYVLYCAAFLLVEKGRFFLWIVPVAAPAVVAFDLGMGTAKVHSLLPVPRRTAAAVYWIQAVLLPTGVVFAAMLLTCILIGPFKPSAIASLACLPHVTVLSFALAGTLYLLLSLMPIGTQPGFWRNVQGAVTGGAWALLIGGVSYLPMVESIHRWGTMAATERALLGTGTVLGFLSLLSSPHLLTYRSTFRPGAAATRERIRGRMIAFPGRTKSLIEPWIRMAFVSVLFALILIAFNYGYAWFLRGSGVQTSYPQLTGYPAALSMATFLIPGFALGVGLRLMWTLRLLRTLPMSGRQLTLFLASFPVLVCQTMWLIEAGVLFALGQGPLVGKLLAAVALFFTGIVLLGVCVTLRHGTKGLIVVLGVMAPLWIVSMVMMRVVWRPSSLTLPTVALAVLGLLLMAGGFLLANRILTRSSQAYRPQNLAMPGWMAQRI